MDSMNEVWWACHDGTIRTSEQELVISDEWHGSMVAFVRDDADAFLTAAAPEMRRLLKRAARSCKDAAPLIEIEEILAKSYGDRQDQCPFNKGAK